MTLTRTILTGTLILALSLPLTASAALKDYFVDTQWLASNRDKVLVVDVRNPALYLLGHIQGAINIDKSQFLSTRHGTVSLVPTVREFERLMDRNGISPDTVVVAYAQHDNPYMARFVWTLRFHGHERSYVLDGGYEKWKADGLTTNLFPATARPSSGYRVRGSAEIRADGDHILARLGNPASLIWDVRRRDEYTGVEVRADRGGHIPGAVHLEWLALLKEVGGVKVLKDEEEIERILQSAGITKDLEITSHCQTGIRSSYATLVLLSLGYNARNYDGSWIEWANCEGYPVEMSTDHAARGRDPHGSRQAQNRQANLNL